VAHLGARLEEVLRGDDDALASIVRDSAAFSEPEGDRVRGAVGKYVHSVVEDEWPLLREGHDSSETANALDGVFDAMQTVEPESAGATGFFDDSVRQLNDALDSRRDRLEAARDGLPVEMALLILFSSLIVGYISISATPSRATSPSTRPHSRRSTGPVLRAEVKEQRETLDFPREASFSREELSGCPRVACPPWTPPSSIHPGLRLTQPSGKNADLRVTPASSRRSPPAPHVVDRTRDGVL
jgi:hypothetical protein